MTVTFRFKESMSSSASDALSIHQELKYLLSWNPPRLVPGQLSAWKMSTKSREPAFFDMHFSEKFKLLRVKRLPSLAQD